MVSVEKNVLRDNCYHPQYALSLPNLQERRKNSTFSGNRVVVNWFLMAEPGSALMARALDLIVELVRLEHFRRSALRMDVKNPEWMKVMCITGPTMLTTAMLTAIYAHRGPSSDIVALKGGIDWKQFGGVFKIRGDDLPREKYYMHFMTHSHVPFLSAYSDKDGFDGQVISETVGEVYFVANKLRWLVPARGFEFIRASSIIPVRRNVMQQIPRSKRDLTLSDKDWVKEYMFRPRFLSPP